MYLAIYLSPPVCSASTTNQKPNLEWEKMLKLPIQNQTDPEPCALPSHTSIALQRCYYIYYLLTTTNQVPCSDYKMP